jgi:hypothetical protein
MACYRDSFTFYFYCDKGLVQYLSPAEVEYKLTVSRNVTYN